MKKSTYSSKFFRFVTLLGLFASIFGIGDSQKASAQFGFRPNQPQSETVNVFLPAPRELKQQLSRAKRYLEEQSYSDAVSELGSLLNNPEAEDFFIDTRSAEGTTASLKAEALRLLGTMPEKGRQSYELQFGAEARRMLIDSVAEGDIQKLTEVSRKFFHTQAGYEAAILLGRHHLDRGRPLAAALSLKRVSDSLVAREFEPELSVTLAVAWLQAGSRGKAETVLVELKKKLPRASIGIGPKQVQLFDDDAQALAWLEQNVGALRLR